MSYVDVSFLDPYDYWKKASGAFVRSLTARDDAEAMERITRGAMEAAGELIRPFKSEQLVSGAVVDVLRNQDATGRPIYNPQDTGANIASKTTERLWKAFSPGAFDTGARIIKAGVGDVSDSGRTYNLFNKLFGAAAGQRITEVNVEAALGFKASRVQPRHPRCLLPLHPRVQLQGHSLAGRNRRCLRTRQRRDLPPHR